jgi:Holliday junction resolvase RusA-like endonuclease
VRVEVDFYLPRPPSIKFSKRPAPIVPPDVDKLARGCLDGLGQGLNGKSGDGLLWGDDSQVIELLACKFYADEREPGAIIRVIPL